MDDLRILLLAIFIPLTYLPLCRPHDNHGIESLVQVQNGNHIPLVRMLMGGSATFTFRVGNSRTFVISESSVMGKYDFFLVADFLILERG